MLKLSPQRKLLVGVLVVSAVGLHFGGSFVKNFLTPRSDNKDEKVNTKRNF